MDSYDSPYLRLKQIIGDPSTKPPIPALCPVGRSTWLRWVQIGKAPKPFKISSRVTVWRKADVLAMIEETGQSK